MLLCTWTNLYQFLFRLEGGGVSNNSIFFFLSFFNLQRKQKKNFIYWKQLTYSYTVSGYFKHERDTCHTGGTTENMKSNFCGKQEIICSWKKLFARDKSLWLHGQKSNNYLFKTKLNQNSWDLNCPVQQFDASFNV